jgi:hypothetical protein
MEGKKVVIGAVLIIVVIVAVVFTAKRMAGGPQPPAAVWGQQVQKIDLKTSEFVTASIGDWTTKYKADAMGRYKNPKTGEYTMVDPIKCAACGQEIPPPDYSSAYTHAQPTAPAAAASNGLPPPIGARDLGVDIGAVEKIKHDYRCPKCGKSPFMF